MAMTETADSQTNEQLIKGRSVFLVETTPAGIAVQTALLTEDGKLLNAPAIFPDVEYAFTQVDELKRLISAHFSQAARLGAQVAAQQAQDNALAAQTSEPELPTPSAPEVAAEAAEASQPSATGRKTLENLKKFVYSGLSQVSKIAQPSNTASPSPANTPHVETTAAAADMEPSTFMNAQATPDADAGDTATGTSGRKPRASGKKVKSDPSVS